jgi:hypothetical protein
MTTPGGAITTTPPQTMQQKNPCMHIKNSLESASFGHQGYIETACSRASGAMGTSNPVFEVVSRQPEYKVNYAPGYVGFTYSDSHFISKGIAYFTRWARMSQIKTSHALLVTGEDECIEAHAQSGVQVAKLSDYFNNPNCQIFFRKPVDLTSSVADQLVNTARAEVGCRYDFALIAGHASSNSHLGRLIREVFGGRSEELVCKLLNHDDRWICSELVAHCLDSSPQYQGKGILRIPAETIDPQELFEDPVLFEPWANELS